MEIAGLAFGVPGIFSVCLELIDRFEHYQSFGAHSRQLTARFKASKLKLREWAKAVGISDGTLAENHHPRLDIPEVAAVLRPILHSLCEIFEKAEQTRTRLSLPQREAEPDPSVWPILYRGDRSKDKAGSSSTKSGINWAIRGRNQFTGQVEIMEVLIDKLYDIVPPDSERGQLHKNFHHENRISGNFSHPSKVQYQLRNHRLGRKVKSLCKLST
jgi:hypothetical protein